MNRKKNTGTLKRKGKVYIVGTGPMNAGLITVRAIECIRNADIIFYDRLIDERVLGYCRRGVPCMFVGKSRGESFSQKNINRLLVTHASRGQTVVRLKGGDPFLFGRGAEEALLLKKEGVPFEVVNGVSSSFAGPAAAGIPLTLRGVSSAVTIVTGQEDPYKPESAVDWSKVWSPFHTTVILMGMKNLSRIVSKLRDVGVPLSVPVTVVQEGATPHQDVVDGTLRTIVSRVKERKITAPAVIVLGGVTRVRRDLFHGRRQRRTLKDKRIVVASTRDSFYSLKEMLEEKGARVRHFEGVVITPPRSFSGIDKELKNIGSYDWLVFTSKNSVSLFMERLKAVKNDVRCLQQVMIAAIGPGTAEKIRSFFLEPCLVPEDFSSQGLAAAFSALPVHKGKVLLARADKASTLLPRALKETGFTVREVTMYRLKRAGFSARQMRALCADNPDVIVCASSENAHSFFSRVRKYGLTDEIKNTRVMGLGTPTQETVMSYGLSCAVPPRFTFTELVRCIEKECR